MINPTRREALSILGMAASSTAIQKTNADEAPKRILLRSSWQTVNIGDIAHTPGVLNILETHLPEVEVTLWPSKLDNGVEELLLARFPKLKIAKNKTPEMEKAFAECDFLLHGSGPSLVAENDVKKWRDETGKPYGVYGITLPLNKSSKSGLTVAEALQETIRVLSGARFVYFRDSHSLAAAKENGCTAPVMEFGPDGAFACDLRDDKKANAFLADNQLETGKFLCVIPRLRYTPYWTIKEHLKFDPIRHQRNEEMKEHDHAQLREAVLQIVQTTDYKVLVCPEDRTQMTIGKEMLYDPLPDTVKSRVVWRPDYWLTGEAISVHDASLGLFGNEMHSPIMCIGHGTPAIVCRWKEQTSKGYMWEDIGLGDWLFTTDNPDEMPGIVPAILEIANNPDKAREKASKAKAFVENRQKETMAQLRRELGLS